MRSSLFLPGLAAIAPRYDSVICDIWGVVHNGRASFPHAVDALHRFRTTRGPVVLLTNAPRLIGPVRDMLDRLGVPRDAYDAIMTSGEATRAALERKAAERPGFALFCLGPERDHGLYEGLDIRLTGMEDAELVLCTGLLDDETEGPDDYVEMLRSFRVRGLPFLCANPDLVVQRGNKLIYCGGALAQAYEALGGEVLYFGKPHPAVFDGAMARLSSHGGGGKCLVIGDGLMTDILGANRYGLDALFIAGGIHGGDIGPDSKGLDALLAAHGVNAIGAMDALKW